MPELDEKLSRLISDDDKMKKVLDMASSIMGQKSESTSDEAKTTPSQSQEGGDIASILSAILSKNPSSQETAAASDSDAGTAQSFQESQANGSQPSSSQTGMAALMSVLPQILQAINGNANLIKSERVNLVKAIAPYMAEKRVGSVERAIKMANMTKAAQSALDILGR